MRTGSLYTGWSVASGCFLGILVMFGVSYSFGVFLTPIQRDLELARSGVSLIFSLQTGVIYVAAAALGIAADRYGVRRMLAFGAAAFLSGVALTVLVRSFSGLLVAYGIVTAIGLSAVYVVSYATVPRWFERRRGLATGLATSGLGVGMVAVPSAAEVLIGRFGWRPALLSIAVCATAVLVVATRLIRESPAGLGSDVDLSGEFPDGYTEAAPFDRTTYREELWAVVASRRFALVFVGWIGVYATIFVVFVHLVAHAADLGVGERAGVIAFAVMGVTTGLARIVVGWLSDRVGRFRTFVACSATMAVATFALPVVDSMVGLLVFAVVFGSAYGGNGALLSPLTADLFGRANPNAVFGLVSLSFAVSGVIAPWGAGLIYDLQGTYTLAFLLAGVIGFVGSGLVALAGFEPTPSR
ncbi:MFS transporter [Natronomonas sp. F2-12]|jgi:MFS family permease|uniref:MFS transporter n=1 Tax=Natronomonas aquatica TaxID=2841590 RepID=A0A9R1CVH4_9EURY|nr:MFS transporter [Natronomonas aquatica]MCQ4334697.1 MFS transporter [Natronomonas aquatica]